MSSGFTAGPLRDYLLPVLAVGATLLLPFSVIAWAYLIIGQAHFLMAYLYQYRGKKMGTVYLGTALLLALVSVWYFFVSSFSIIPILIFAGILFALHFAIDEFTLHGEAFTKVAWISIVGFTVLFSSLILLVALPGAWKAPLLGMGALLSAVVVRFLVSQRVPTRAERYLWFVAVLLIVLGFFLGLPGNVLGVVLLLHFFNWYVGFGLRLRTRPERARTYWMEVAGTLALCAFGAFVFTTTQVAMLGALFTLGPYYAWAIAHILLSFVSALTPKKSGA